MDRVIEKKKGIRAVFRKKNIPYFLAGVFVIFVLWLLLRDRLRKGIGTGTAHHRRAGIPA